MDGLNRCTFIGNLGADGELRAAGGDMVLNFRIGVTESYKDRSGDRKERTDWIPCQIWGKRAEALAPMLTRGKQVYVEGNFRTRTYEKDGDKRYATEIAVREVILLGGKRDGASRSDDGYAPQGRSEGGGYSRGGGNGGGAARAPQDIVESPPDAATFGNDDDIPFAHTVGYGPWRV